MNAETFSSRSRSFLGNGRRRTFFSPKQRNSKLDWRSPNCRSRRPKLFALFRFRSPSPFLSWGITPQQVLCISDSLWAAGQAARGTEIVSYANKYNEKKNLLTLLNSSDTRDEVIGDTYASPCPCFACSSWEALSCLQGSACLAQTLWPSWEPSGRGRGSCSFHRQIFKSHLLGWNAYFLFFNCFTTGSWHQQSVFLF